MWDRLLGCWKFGRASGNFQPNNADVRCVQGVWRAISSTSRDIPDPADSLASGSSATKNFWMLTVQVQGAVTGVRTCDHLAHHRPCKRAPRVASSYKRVKGRSHSVEERTSRPTENPMQPASHHCSPTRMASLHNQHWLVSGNSGGWGRCRRARQRRQHLGACPSG